MLEIPEILLRLSRLILHRSTVSSVFPVAAGAGAPTDPQFQVTNPQQMAIVEDEVAIEGLMYGALEDGTTQLFGLSEAADNNNTLVMVRFDYQANDWDLLTEVYAYGGDGGTSLKGLSYDVTRGLNGTGLAISPSGTLYEVITSNLSMADDGNLEITGGIADVYMMYIASSTADVYITMTRYTLSDTTITYTPTDGDGAYLFTDEDDAEIYTPDGAGGAMLGTMPMIPPGDDSEDPDVIWSPGNSIVYYGGSYYNRNGTFLDSQDQYEPNNNFAEIGAFPGGAFRPGIILPQDENGVPQDIGLIQVGGGIFGDIDISGSVGRIYAGYLGANRITIGGDLGQLVVNTQAGGVEESDGEWQPADDVILDVRGTMGSFYSNGDWGLPIRVRGLSDAPEFPGVIDNVSGRYYKTYREIEFIGETDPTSSAFSFIHGGLGAIIQNDTLQTAEFLGTIDDKLSVVGFIDDDDPDDLSDFYSFGLMAGQTITITAYNTSYDYSQWIDYLNGHPDFAASDVVYSDYSIVPRLYDPNLAVVAIAGEQDIATGAPMSITYTATQAGIYTIEVPDLNDFGVHIAGFPYRIEVEGANNNTLGGGNVNADLRYGVLRGEDQANIQVVNGNLGAVSVGNFFRSGIVRCQ